MKVATRLALGFTLQVVLLGGMLVYQVRTIREATTIAHDLTAMSSRVYRTASEQVGRVAQLEENSAKYLVTRDAGYLAKFNELAAEFTDDLASLGVQELTAAERAEVQRLADHWRSAQADVPQDTVDAGDVLLMAETSLDSLRAGSLRLSQASYAAMVAQLQRADEAAHRAERLTWLAALLVLLITVLVAVTLVRFIDAGLSRLAAGTREVAKGRFGHRLDAHGNDEFAEVARDFNTMTARLDELDRMKRDFTSKVSHDLKTPLASMQETIQVLLDELPGDLNQRQRRLLELNQQSGQRLYGMLAKLLDLSRMEAGGEEPRMDSVAVTELARSVAAAHNVPGHLPPGDDLVVRGDADRLRQLLDNLAENAAKFSPDGGVEICAARLPGEDGGTVVRLAVADRGPGVPRADRERIFDRFYQGEAGRAVASRGVGLGLTICREIVVMHGGRIGVLDRDGGGSIFEVLLPAAAVHANGRPAATIDGTARPAPAGRGSA